MSRHYTPLRYPGGKQKLTPFIFELLEYNGLIGGSYVEPYAGGAGVALELLLDGYVSQIYLNDSSYPVFAFWKSIISNPEEFCRHIATVSLNVEEWKRRREIVRNPSEYDLFEVGFSTFYLNRCNRSGVISGGLIGGLSQQGQWKMDARFSRNELIRRVEAVASKKDKIFIENWDAEKFILQYIPNLPDSTLIYCDPPYYEKASRLYLNAYKKEDHSRIASVIQNSLNHKWIVSYDKSVEILQEFSERRSFIYSLRYNASKRYEGQEIFILSDSLKLPEFSLLKCIGDKVGSTKLAKEIIKELAG